MDFKNIPKECHPAYTWLWNTNITAVKTKRQIDEMYDAGIRAFYVLVEPANFRPTVRRTFLSPEYMSDEYIDRVYFAYSYAKEKGMHTWLYNEGGFPSGMVCGKIREMRPDLARLDIARKSIILPAKDPYKKSKDALSGFIGAECVMEGSTFSEDKEITECFAIASDNPYTSMRSDNARHENVELFLKLTHEKLKARFGDAFGKDVDIMFDDEADMATGQRILIKYFPMNTAMI